MDEYVTTSAAWFTLSLLNAGLAQSKGRSGLAWWALSLLLGPVATLILVATDRVPEGSRESIPAARLLIGFAVVAVVVLVGLFAAGQR